MLPIRTINPGEVYYPLPKTPPVKPVEPMEGSAGMNNNKRPSDNYDPKRNSEKQNSEKQSSQQPIDVTKLLKEAFPYDSAARCAVQQALIGSKLDVTAEGFGFKKPQKLDILVDGFGLKEKRALDVYS